MRKGQRAQVAHAMRAIQALPNIESSCVQNQDVRVDENGYITKNSVQLKVIIIREG